MGTFLFFCLGATMLAVLGTLILGLFTMARGGDKAGTTGNRLMWWRIRLQILAVVLFILTAFALGHHA
ncbi:twin transmembrane helix small protein [Nitrospirillum sp. BR 11164]|uniref:twin transmembrane helix small protein n=1 Tax=Nitrospirillum sp. BR 11164 TaxID=3104324 RepID=UPI002AFE0EF5|nr:twin transmembrane helix small protein [Nitrospirillum sp. BR 11164]MEA1649228.1 twin transmembrane helix small protein [Nitrospirillum sp. BR 11164]